MPEETAFIQLKILGDASTADTNVFNAENESHVQHRDALGVQDLHS